LVKPNEIYDSFDILDVLFSFSRVQQDATNFDFRKRHYEMKRAKEELEYQMKTVGKYNIYRMQHLFNKITNQV